MTTNRSVDIQRAIQVLFDSINLTFKDLFYKEKILWFNIRVPAVPELVFVRLYFQLKQVNLDSLNYIHLENINLFTYINCRIILSEKIIMLKNDFMNIKHKHFYASSNLNVIVLL